MINNYYDFWKIGFFIKKYRIKKEITILRSKIIIGGDFYESKKRIKRGLLERTDNIKIKDLTYYKKLDKIVEETKMENAKAEGLSEGISQSKIEIAKNLLKKGMDISDISDVTGLSKEEIQKLQEDD